MKMQKLTFGTGQSQQKSKNSYPIFVWNQDGSFNKVEGNIKSPPGSRQANMVYVLGHGVLPSNSPETQALIKEVNAKILKERQMLPLSTKIYKFVSKKFHEYRHLINNHIYH